MRRGSMLTQAMQSFFWMISERSRSGNIHQRVAGSCVTSLLSPVVMAMLLTLRRLTTAVLPDSANNRPQPHDMSWQACKLMSACIVFVSLTSCRALITPPKQLYLEDATGTATQDEIVHKWGPPQAQRKLSSGESVWV